MVSTELLVYSYCISDLLLFLKQKTEKNDF